MSREKPTPPSASECCEGGCAKCVWDLYQDELEAWRAEQSAIAKSEHREIAADSQYDDK